MKSPWGAAASTAVALTLTLTLLVIRNSGALWALALMEQQAEVAMLLPKERATPLAADPEVPRCTVWLPPAAPGTAEALVARVQELFESPTSSFPFKTSAGYAISDGETEGIGRAMEAAASRLPSVRTSGGQANCHASTYDGPEAGVLGSLFAPGGAGAVGEGDAVVDLGAGIGKVLAAVAVATNATLIRGIELSASRYEVGCGVLRTLEREFAQRPQLAAPGRPRRVELVQGDLFDLPSGFFADLPARVVLFSYCNCFPYSLVSQIFRYAADLDRESVRLLTSKEPKAIPAALHRAGFTGTVMRSFHERGRPGERPRTERVRPPPLSVLRGGPGGGQWR